MASLQVLKSPLLTTPVISVSRSNFPRKKSDSRKKFINLIGMSRRYLLNKKLIVRCAPLQEDKPNEREEPAESLFMKELKRRGMNPNSLPKDAKRANEDTKVKEEDGGFSKRNAVTTDIEKNLSNQRERSMAMNSEGLELKIVVGARIDPFVLLADPGLIPKAKLLLSLGGTFFLAFWPLIAVTVALFSALCLYFGAAFIHNGSDTSISPPQYIDPYALLEEDKITRIIPRVD